MGISSIKMQDTPKDIIGEGFTITGWKLAEVEINEDGSKKDKVWKSEWFEISIEGREYEARINIYNTDHALVDQHANEIAKSVGENIKFIKEDVDAAGFSSVLGKIEGLGDYMLSLSQK